MDAARPLARERRNDEVPAAVSGGKVSQDRSVIGRIIASQRIGVAQDAHDGR
jgi:hypothetical protein